MPQSKDETLKQLAEEFQIAQNLDFQEHINLLRHIDNYSKDHAIEVLNYFLTLETNPEILEYLVKAISKYNDTCSIDVLSELLLWKERFKEQSSENYTKARCLAATVLGNLKDNKAVLPLLYVLNNKNENYKLRLSCAEALGRIGNNYAVAPLIDVVSDEDEKSIYLRESAAKALGMLGDLRAVDPLVSILETKKGLIDKFTFLKERIIESLGRIGEKDNRTLKALKNALMDEAAYIRLGAIEALSEIANDEAIPLVENMLKDEEEDVARGAVCALYNMCGQEYIENLLDQEDLAGWCKDEIECILNEEDEEDDDE